MGMINLFLKSVPLNSTIVNNITIFNVDNGAYIL